jgi:hypothetical protein
MERLHVLRERDAAVQLLEGGSPRLLLAGTFSDQLITPLVQMLGHFLYDLCRSGR